MIEQRPEQRTAKDRQIRQHDIRQQERHNAAQRTAAQDRYKHIDCIDTHISYIFRRHLETYTHKRKRKNNTQTANNQCVIIDAKINIRKYLTIGVLRPYLCGVLFNHQNTLQ